MRRGVCSVVFVVHRGRREGRGAEKKEDGQGNTSLCQQSGRVNAMDGGGEPFVLPLYCLVRMCYKQANPLPPPPPPPFKVRSLSLSSTFRFQLASRRSEEKLRADVHSCVKKEVKGREEERRGQEDRGSPNSSSSFLEKKISLSLLLKTLLNTFHSLFPSPSFPPSRSAIIIKLKSDVIYSSPADDDLLGS